MALRIEGAPNGFAATQVPVGTTAVKLVDAKASRRELILQDLGSLGHVYLGPDDSVTPSTGVEAVSLPNPLNTSAEIWAIATTGTSTVGVLELFDVED